MDFMNNFPPIVVVVVITYHTSSSPGRIYPPGEDWAHYQLLHLDRFYEEIKQKSTLDQTDNVVYHRQIGAALTISLAFLLLDIQQQSISSALAS